MNRDERLEKIKKLQVKVKYFNELFVKDEYNIKLRKITIERMVEELSDLLRYEEMDTSLYLKPESGKKTEKTGNYRI